MEAARIGLVSVDDYLRGEPAGEVRHEYVAGTVYAMAGASEEHNSIALNLASLKEELESLLESNIPNASADGGETRLGYK